MRCRAPTGGWSSSASRWSSWMPSCAALAAQARPDRAPCAGGRTRSRGWRARWACRRCSPTTTTSPRRWRATPGARRAGRRRHRLAHLQGPRDLRARRGADRRPAQPYTVFTPYKRAWLAKVTPFYLQALSGAQRYADALAPPARRLSRRRCRRWPTSASSRPTCAELEIPTGSQRRRRAVRATSSQRIDRYDRRATSRRCAAPATWACTCASAPSRSAQLAARRIALRCRRQRGRRDLAGRADLARLLLPDAGATSRTWRQRQAQLQAGVRRASSGSTASTPTLFAAWCEGRTGYPLVDAAMAQINQTGYMHNRLRMVVASFLCKDLGHRLAPRRALLRRAAERLRAGVQQRRLAMGQLHAAATPSPTSASSTR